MKNTLMTQTLALAISLCSLTAFADGTGQVGSGFQYSVKINCDSRVSKKDTVNFETSFDTNSRAEAETKKLDITDKGVIGPEREKGFGAFVAIQGNPHTEYFQSEGAVEMRDGHGWLEYNKIQMLSAQKEKQLEARGTADGEICEPNEDLRTKFKQVLVFKNVDVKAMNDDSLAALKSKMNGNDATLTFNCERSVQTNNLSEGCQ